MNIQEALAYIHSAQKFGSLPGLARVGALLDALGNPHKKLKYVHITGTNGKGSTAAMLESVLRAAGYKTGLYISPYLEDFRERIQFMRAMISEEELCLLTVEAAGAIERIAAAGGPSPTEFEIVTAIAFRYFAMKRCDIVVLEVGMGGAGDATNIIPACEAAVLTPVSMDHAEVLGSTLLGIAREKCGIIKPGCHAVCCPGQDDTAYEVIRDRCGALGVPLQAADETALEVVDTGLGGSHIVYRGRPIYIPLAGAHQIQNALTALETVEALRKRGWEIGPGAVLDGMKSARWSGRLEKVREEPLCIIDGAHNREAVGVLCGAADTMLRGRRIHVVMAMSSDKAYEACVPPVARRAENFIATEAPYFPKALPAKDLALAAGGHCSAVYVRPRVRDAVDLALELAGEGDVILACGSLYMIGEAKRRLLAV